MFANYKYKIGDLVIRDHDDFLKGNIAIICKLGTRPEHYFVMTNKRLEFKTWSSEYFKKLS